MAVIKPISTNISVNPLELEMNLDPASFEPLFYQLAKKIKERIKSGEYGPGELLPSEKEFCDKYEISRGTVRQAFQELIKEGLVIRKQGKGTFVSEETIPPQTAVYPFGNTMFLVQGLKKQGIEVDIRVLGKRLVKREEIPDIITDDDNGDEKLFEMSRIISGNKEPWIYDLQYYPYTYWNENFEDMSLREIFKAKGNLVMNVDVIIEPIIIDKKIAEYLQVPKGSPAMLLNRVFTTEKGDNIYGRSIIRGDRCKYYFRHRNSW
jgi:GntR family transcriptional regulator